MRSSFFLILLLVFSFANKEEIIKRTLEKIAVDIIKAQNRIRSIENQINILEKNIAEKEKNIKKIRKRLDNLKKIRIKFVMEKEVVKKRLALILSKALTTDLIKSKVSNEDSLIFDEVNKILANEYEKRLKLLQKDYSLLLKKIEATKKEIDFIENYIKKLELKKRRLKQLKAEAKVLLKKLKMDKLSYKKRLEKIKKEKSLIIDTLKNIKVRVIDSPIIKKKSIKYSGPKTIAPIKNFKVKRKFGNFKDPIYNTKIFSQSVVLEGKENSKVRNIFDGKVVFANKTSILKYVVVVKADNGMNIVYGNLDKLSPIIKVGMRIKKGYVIGRVKRRVHLSITYKGKYINPLEVIRM